MYFSVCLRDLKFNSGLLRFKVILEMELSSFEGNYVFVGTPSGSEIQWLLVAIQGHSGNQIVFF